MIIPNMNPLNIHGQKQLIHHECASTNPSSTMLKAVVTEWDDDIKVLQPHPTDDTDDFTSILRAITIEEESSELRDPAFLRMTENPEERELVPQESRRRTRATEWGEPSRTCNQGDINPLSKKRHEHHRRSLAMTADDFMEITWVCDELHGPGAPPFFETRLLGTLNGKCMETNFERFH